jgi:hypothetical protein
MSSNGCRHFWGICTRPYRGARRVTPRVPALRRTDDDMGTGDRLACGLDGASAGSSSEGFLASPVASGVFSGNGPIDGRRGGRYISCRAGRHYLLTDRWRCIPHSSNRGLFDARRSRCSTRSYAKPRASPGWGFDRGQTQAPPSTPAGVAIAPLQPAHRADVLPLGQAVHRLPRYPPPGGNGRAGDRRRHGSSRRQGTVSQSFDAVRPEDTNTTEHDNGLHPRAQSRGRGVRSPADALME